LTTYTGPGGRCPLSALPMLYSPYQLLCAISDLVV
jgi:hypothetical protein